jgi:hypothetical protein
MKNDLNELDALLQQQLDAIREGRDDRDLAKQINTYLGDRPALSELLSEGILQVWTEQPRGRMLSIKLHALLRKGTTSEEAERIADDVCEYLDQTADVPCGIHAEVVPLDQAGVAHFFPNYDPLDDVDDLADEEVAELAANPEPKEED